MFQRILVPVDGSETSTKALVAALELARNTDGRVRILSVQESTAIAEIVHDIDLKDSKFGREETTGISSLIAGVAMANAGDEERIAQGAAVFDNLYQYFRSKRG